jgi:hypothetical protein
MLIPGKRLANGMAKRFALSLGARKSTLAEPSHDLSDLQSRYVQPHDGSGAHVGGAHTHVAWRSYDFRMQPNARRSEVGLIDGSSDVDDD